MDFFYSESFREKNRIIPQEEWKHIKVKRIKDNEIFGILDGKGNIYYVYFENKEIKIKDIKSIKIKKEIYIASPIPEGRRIHFLCEKLAEFGVKGFLPLITERTQRILKQDKIKKYIIEGMKQSGNPNLPEIYKPMKLEEVFEIGFKNKNIYFGDINGRKPEIIKEGLFLVGPEGGFTKEEKNLIISKGGIPLKLSEYVLRIETAVISFLALSSSS